MKPALCSALLGLVLIIGCTDAAGPPPGAEENPAGITSTEPRTAQLTGGIIRRDRETREAIERTAAVAIQPGSGESLQLTVTKSRYRLDVHRDGEPVKTYPVALGGCPEGHKTREGDERTPEGTYLLIPHHPSPSFGSCFYICYPNKKDAQKAWSEGRIDDFTRQNIENCLENSQKPPHNTPLGGLILLHGIKQRWVPGLTTNNWTLGCIAMENDHLLELLAAWSPDDRTTIRILP